MVHVMLAEEIPMLFCGFVLGDDFYFVVGELSFFFVGEESHFYVFCNPNYFLYELRVLLS